MNYTSRMDFEWDEEKRRAMLATASVDSTSPMRHSLLQIQIASFNKTRDISMAKTATNSSDELRGDFLFLFIRHEMMYFESSRLVKPTHVRQCAMKTVRMKIDVQQSKAKNVGRLDARRVEATTETDIAKHKATDESASMQDAAKFARRVRRRLGFSQTEFAERIDVSLDTIRNWEQGKRSPTGAAKALLKVLDKAPEAALAALH